MHFFAKRTFGILQKNYLDGSIENRTSDSDLQYQVDTDCFVLFLINQSRQVMLLNQSAFGEGGCGIWDYHVVFFDSRKGLIFDFDSMLPFPSNANDYVESTFPEAKLASIEQIPLLKFEPAQIRLIPAQDYVRHFQSDRSHMLDEGGIPMQAFPKWKAIQPPDAAVDLRTYWNPCESIFGSKVFGVQQFREKLIV